jgi:simple sugar transport system permease protein
VAAEATFPTYDAAHGTNLRAGNERALGDSGATEPSCRARRPLACGSGPAEVMVRLRGLVSRIAIPVLALATAFVCGAILIVLTDGEHLASIGTDPLGAIGGAVGLVLRGYGAMLAGAIGDPGRMVTAIQSGTERDIAIAIRPLTEALLVTAPLIFVALAVGTAFHAGLVNFGADGQFLIGSLGATIGAIALDGSLPPGAILVAALAVGTLFGAAYGFVPGFLKARTGAHEVITTLMLNTIAAQIVLYVLRSGAFSGPLPSAVSVPRLSDLPTIRLDWGILVALLVAIVVSFLLFRTGVGFELRAAGFNRTAARSAGMRPGRATVLGMSLSGALAGMGGAFLALGAANGPTDSGMGYVALALALIAGLRPSGIVLLALLYGALDNGAKRMVVETGIPFDLLVVIITFVLMFVAAPSLVRSIWRVRADPTAEIAAFRPVLPG